MIMVPALFLSGNPFEHHVGHFWGLPDMRDYMRARTRLIEHLRYALHAAHTRRLCSIIGAGIALRDLTCRIDAAAGQGHWYAARSECRAEPAPGQPEAQPWGQPGPP